MTDRGKDCTEACYTPYFQLYMATPDDGWMEAWGWGSWLEALHAALPMLGKPLEIAYALFDIDLIPAQIEQRDDGSPITWGQVQRIVPSCEHGYDETITHRYEFRRPA